MKRLLLSLPILLIAMMACHTDTKPKETTMNMDGTGVAETVKQRDSVCEHDYYLGFEQPAIRAEIEGNDVLLTFDTVQFGGEMSRDGYLLPGMPLKVENLKGVPRSVFIADIGQDNNPILCVLLENGDVQILKLWNCLAYGDFQASEVLYNDIYSFRDGGGGLVENEDGEAPFYEYTTIYAITANGEKEIDLYGFYPQLRYYEYNGDNVFPSCLYQLNLTNDWKMRYVVERFREESVKEYKGHFWNLSMDWDEMVFRYGYELTRLIDGEDPSDSPQVSEISEKGVFEARLGAGSTFVITPTEGLDLAGIGLNHPIVFEIVPDY